MKKEFKEAMIVVCKSKIEDNKDWIDCLQDEEEIKCWIEENKILNKIIKEIK